MLSIFQSCRIFLGTALLLSIVVTGSAKASGAAKFHIDQEDYLVYTGSGSTYRTGDGKPQHLSFNTKLTVFGIDKDLKGGQRLGWYRNQEFPSLAITESCLSILSLSDLERFEKEPNFPISLGCPIPPRRELRLGDKWETAFNLESAMRPRVICKVAGEEPVAGRKCLRVELTPKKPLPYLMEDRAIGDGMLPGREYLTAFKARCWVAQDTGWVVKTEYSFTVATEYDELSDGVSAIFESWTLPMVAQRRSTISESSTLLLATAKKVSGAELAELNDQANRLDYIHELVKNLSWPGARNRTTDSDWADNLIVEYSNKYPKSQFDPLVKELSALSGYQRRDDIVNASWHKLKTELIDKPAPDFKGEYTDGKAFDMQSLNGKPTLLIFLWLSKDFPGYRAPDLKTFADKWRTRGVQAVFVTENRCTKDEAKMFMSKFGFESPFVIPAVVSNTAYKGDPCFAYGFAALVNVALLDSQGKVKYYRGDIYPNEIEPVLEKLIDG